MIGEKLLTFADAAREYPPFAKELPRFLAAIWQVFNEYEIAGDVASRRPSSGNACGSFCICVIVAVRDGYSRSGNCARVNRSRMQRGAPG